MMAVVASAAEAAQRDWAIAGASAGGDLRHYQAEHPVGDFLDQRQIVSPPFNTWLTRLTRVGLAEIRAGASPQRSQPLRLAS
jgi:hypothetical protein